ncbi:hypothetical protein [Celeribacter sp.]|uniref:hypothetical protein n=1 Tax=Celeribacter sp. TaxID=1890673 RepID=UPI003A8E1D21
MLHTATLLETNMRLMPRRFFSSALSLLRAFCASLGVLGAASLSAVAAEPEGQAFSQEEIAQVLRTYYEEEIAELVQEPAILGAIRAQNERTQGLTEAEIIDLDQQWRAQVGETDHPMVDAVVQGAVAERLLHKIARAGGVIAEIFVMDAQGLNVVAAAATSDYWQGDEAKFQNSFGVGKDGMEIGEIEFDASIGISQAQVSATIVDPATGEPIGAVTVGVVADLLL